MLLRHALPQQFGKCSIVSDYLLCPNISHYQLLSINVNWMERDGVWKAGTEIAVIFSMKWCHPCPCWKSRPGGLSSVGAAASMTQKSWTSWWRLLMCSGAPANHSAIISVTKGAQHNRQPCRPHLTCGSFKINSDLTSRILTAMLEGVYSTVPFIWGKV